MTRRISVLPALFLVACFHTDGDPPEANAGRLAAEVELTSAVDVDFSKTVVAVHEDLACVILRFAVQVQCMGRNGEVVGSFGRTGEGPAEFGEPEQLVRGSGGRIGVADVARARLTIWQPDGTLLQSVPIPPFFKPVAPFDRTILGSYDDLSYDPGIGPDPGSPSARLAEVEIPSGDVRRTIDIPGPADFSAPIECSGRMAQQGSRNSQGGIVFGLCSRELMFWQSDGGVTIVRQPYTPEPRSDRDIEDFNEEYRRGLEGKMPPEAIDQIVATLTRPGLTTPYGWSRTRLHDRWDRLWVATTRDRIQASWFHVYADTVFVGAVQIRDRLKAFDIVGSTLVALVEREPTEGWNGVWRQALDWYELSPP